MNLLKKFLRGVYYFCVGVKSAVCDFLDWYTNNRSIPRVLRSRASLAVIVLAVAAGLFLAGTVTFGILYFRKRA